MPDTTIDSSPELVFNNRILVADDSEAEILELCQLVAQWGHEVVVTHDGEEAWKALQEPDAPNIAILDWTMPGGADGIEVCRRLRARTEGPYVYVILVSDSDAERDLAEGLNAGADAFVAKPWHNLELSAHLNAGQRIIDLEQALIRAQEKLREQATHDALTGVWNRGGIMHLLNRELLYAHRQKTPISILMGDIDHFKLVNDTHGHLAGDVVLREAARRMREAARGYDTVGRYGGEEFLTILPYCDEAGALIVAERMREAAAAAPVEYHGTMIPIALSLGVATSPAGQAADSTAFIAAADAALYRAKEGGRNRVVTATAEEIAQAEAPV